MLRNYRLELLFILTVVLLIGQLAWPSTLHWWRRPSPGRIGIDEFDSSHGLAVGYAVYLPVGYDANDQPWPLIVFLHGSGQNGNDPQMVRGIGPLSLVQKGVTLPAIIVAPQCLPSTSWDPDSVAKFIEHVTLRYRADSNRVYLVGYSMGGYGTLQSASSHPDLFAAIVPICGGGNSASAKSLRHTPTWAFHGAKDTAVPLAASETMIQAIRDAGGNPQFTVLPEAGHAICEAVCQRDDLWQWLFRQRRIVSDLSVGIPTIGPSR